MKVKLTILSLFFAVIVSAQINLNPYKYAIIPQKYSFQKTENEHQLNALLKFLFEKKGFIVVKQGVAVPNDLQKNPCLGLVATLVDNSSLFTTRLTIELTDCRNQVVFRTEEGSSRVKDRYRSNHNALRSTFKCVNKLPYEFDEKMVIKDVLNYNPEEPQEPEPIKLVAKPITEPNLVAEKKETTKAESENTSVLYLQKTTFGYQLIDSTPKIIYLLLETSKDGVYIIEGKNGIAYKKDDVWVAEYFIENKKILEVLKVKD